MALPVPTYKLWGQKRKQKDRKGYKTQTRTIMKDNYNYPKF